MPKKNPFEYDAANNLSDEMIADFYVDDFNHARFIQSKRNILLVGERGSGKSMALLYNRLELQLLLAAKAGKQVSLENVGVYVPCNTPLAHRTEYELLPEFEAAVLSEHLLVLSIAHAFLSTIANIPDILRDVKQSQIAEELAVIFDAELPAGKDLLKRITLFIQRELRRTETQMNRKSLDSFPDDLFSFVSLMVPLIRLAASFPQLNHTHFSLLIDDAHVLNSFQLRALNSWLAYRDHSLFSFKVATTKRGRHSRVTSSGGTIIEGHDYTQVDLQEPYQNKDSDFYKLAKELISRRLNKIGSESSPEEFFPISSSMAKDLEESEKLVRIEAEKRLGTDPSKAITDYVYKYKRVHYFRNRHPKANRPPYSGFEMLVFLSTGIIRNLLEPCYWMYDKAISESAPGAIPDSITPKVQTEVILERSQRLWERLRDGLDRDIQDCSKEDSAHAYQLLDQIAILFRERLLKHESEPRALSFTVSSGTASSDELEEVLHLLEILKEAQLLYARSGPAKDKGRREVYYVPNRMLWPDRGLDPQGQHARVSIKASALWAAARNGVPIPFEERQSQQGKLWNDNE